MRFLPAILSNLLLMGAAFGLGSLLQPLFPRNLSRLDRVAVTTLSGLGLLGTVLFLVGMIRFSLATVLVVLIPFALLGFIRLALESKEFLPTLRRARPPSIPLAIICVVVAVTAIGGLAEPVGDIKLDAIAYHFLGPRVWIRQGVIRPVLDEANTAFPAIVEVQYAALMRVGGTRAPELFSVAALLLMFLLAAAVARRAGLDPSSAWWLVALLGTMPALYRGAYGGLNDAIYAAFVIAAARIAFDSERLSHWASVGLLCGFAIGTKYTGLIATALIVVCALAFAPVLRGRFTATILKPMAVVCAVAFIVGCPWYLRNWALLGCPIYPPPPLLPHFFHTPHFPPAAIQRFLKQMRLEGRGMGRGFFSLFMLPFNLTFHPANFLNGAGGIGLVPLTFVPFCFRSYNWDPFAKRLAGLGCLLTITWFVTMQESRYLIHVYVIAAIFGVAGWNYVLRVGTRCGRILSALTIATSLSYGLFMIVAARADDLHAAISASFETHRRSQEIPFLDTFAYLNSDRSVKNVLVLAPRFPTFYLRKNYLKPVGRRGEESISYAHDQQALLQNASSLGITHVVDVRVDGNDFLISAPPSNLTLVLEAEDQRVYRVVATP